MVKLIKKLRFETSKYENCKLLKTFEKTKQRKNSGV